MTAFTGDSNTDLTGVRGEATPVRSECNASRHGTKSARNRQGCICPESLRDRTRYDLDVLNGRPRTIDATGTRRRIQALMSIGWSGGRIMAELGWPGANLGAQFYQQARVHRRTAERVSAVYVRLADTPGPSSRTRKLAARKGWLEPLWWDADTIDDPAYNPHVVVGGCPCHNCHPQAVDPIAVERFVCGDNDIRLTRAEKHDAFALMLDKGMTLTDAAQRLGLSGATAKVYASRLEESA